MKPSTDRKRILFINYGLPYPPLSGSRIRDFNLIKHLARDHTILLLSLLEFANEPAMVSALSPYCSLVDLVPTRRRSKWEHLPRAWHALIRGEPLETAAYYYPEMWQRIGNVVEQWKVDIVQIQQSFLAPYVEAVPSTSGCKRVLAFENLGFLQYRRMGRLATNWETRLRHLSNAAIMRRWEPRYAERFDHCVMVSPIEARLLQAANPRLQVSVVDNGVDSQAYQPLDPPITGHDVLYVGTMSYPPNVDAALLFANEILPHVQKHVPDARLVIVGKDPVADIVALSSRPDVIVAGGVPDIVPYYQQTCATVVPLRGGGGTRLKILESMALGRPVVSTTIGCEGLAVVDGEHVVVRDDPESFASATVSLLQNPTKAAALARRARALVEERYDWAVISRKLADIYARL